MRNLNRRIALIILTLGLFAGLPGRVDAAFVTVFKTEKSFLEATCSTLINFEGVVPDDGFSSLTSIKLIGGVTFGTSGKLGIAGKDAPIAGSPFDSALLFSDFGTPITSDLTTAGTGFTAVGGCFDNLTTSSGTVTLSLWGTKGLLSVQTFATSSLGRGQPHTFFGYTVTGDSITSITCDTSVVFPGIDNFRYGFARSAIVPEPSSLALAGIACLVGLGHALARRKRTMAARA